MKIPRIGDRIKGSRVFYDEEGPVEGVVTKIDRYIADGKENAIIDVKTDDGYEDWCGADTITEIIPKPAPKLPQNAVGWCHYCGQTAYSFNFFDVLACPECGS